MKFSPLKLTACTLLYASSPLAFSQTDSAFKVLSDQAQFWQSKGDYAKAAQSWKKILLIDPSDDKALYGLGVSELNSKNPENAKSYLAKMKSVAPNSKYILALEQEIILRSTSSGTLIESARKAGQRGDVEKSKQLFEQALGNVKPQGPLGLEYYSVLDRSKESKKEAIEGFARLAKESPEDPMIQLEYAKRLITVEASRAEGINRLASLANDPSLKEAAVENWRQALIWGGPPNGRAIAQFDRYLKVAPDDTEIRSLLAEGKSGVRATAVSSGPYYNPKILRDAKEALAAGDDQMAFQILQDGIATNPTDPWTRFELAKLYLKEGQKQEAIGLVNGLLSSQPNDANTLYATAMLYSTMDDWPNALKFIEKVNPRLRTPTIAEFQRAAWMEVQLIYAVEFARKGSTTQSLSIFNRAELIAGQDPALLGKIARSYIDAGMTDKGVNLLRQKVTLSAGKSTDLLLEYGNVLLKTNQSVESSNVLRQLQLKSLSAEQKQSFDQLVYSYSVKQAESLIQLGKPKEATRILVDLQSQRPTDSATLIALSNAYAANGQGAKAIELLQGLEERYPNNPDIIYSLALANIQSRNFPKAISHLDRYITFDPTNPEILDKAGRAYRSMNKLSTAQELFNASLESQERNAISTGGASSSLANITSLGTVPTDFYKGKIPPKPETTRIVASRGKNPLNDPFAMDTEIPNPVALPKYLANNVNLKPISTAEALQEIKETQAPQVLAGLSLRSRTGDSGSSRLTDTQTPVEVRLPLGDGRVAVRATPINLNSGSIAQNTYSSLTYGSGPLATGSVSTPQVSGLGLSLAYDINNLGLDIGMTPQGFQYSTITGGIRYGTFVNSANTIRVTGALSSRPVSDSVLSFAGVTDNRTNLSWGGVTATGGRIGVSKSFGVDNSNALFMNASYHAIEGNNVDSNTRTEFSGGVYKEFRQTASERFRIGLNMTNFGFNKDLSYYTYGQGGYFSPQQYLAVSIPLSVEGQQEDLIYSVTGSLGWQTFNQDGSNFFPTNIGLQNAANASLAANPQFGKSAAVYPSNSVSNLAYSLNASTLYKLDPQLFLGGVLQFENSGNYNQWAASLFLKYSFEEITQSLKLPISPLLSPYSQFPAY